MVSAANRVNVRLSGSGGQGIALAATVLAEAALSSELYATMLQEHGPEARGGATRADLSLSLYPIANPQFQVPDLCLVLSDKAWTRFGERLVGQKDVGLVVDVDRVGLVDVSGPERESIIALPFEEAAKVRIGAKVVTNMICAASLARLIEAISVESLSEVAERRSPPAFKEKNRQAIKLGWQMMDEYLDAHAPSWRLSGNQVGRLARVADNGGGVDKEGVAGSALSA
ncbi:MAG: 2-oxoacid:acceptor oxidoreductase family protein [Actinobacteria bacterium]|jgi:2-oxoglutarate ferredoxin oxidoreductase subunit gamma|nr:2-oxoacid:acceptor oxidoreductase family protein [Actinomycetota bacterium]